MADPNQEAQEERDEQESEDPGFFRYTDRPGAFAGITPLMESEKYQRAKAVYDRLVKAKGDFRYPVPEFVMSSDERMVAWMNYNDVQIGLEEKAYDVCAGFGDLQEAAIATLLGHELTHYYEKHSWRRDFVEQFRELEIGKRLDAIQDHVVNETQADYLGGFLAYSAGFAVFDGTPEFMAQVYKAYKFPDDIGEKYPVLSDRQALARHSAARMKQLIDIFNMANWLNAIGKFEEANAYYRYILREYQSRELYNNLGVLYARRALEKFKPEEVQFLYPFELDLAAVRSSGRDVDLERKQLLREAILQFDYAINLDPDYATAYLNKASAYTLLGDLARGQFYAETEALTRAKEAGLTKVEGDAEVLLGIIAALREDESLAQQYFDSAIGKGSSLGAINKDVLQGKSLPQAQADTFPGESIDGVDLLEFADNPEYEEEISYAVGESVNMYQNPAPSAGAHSRIQMHYNGDTSVIIIVHMTNEDYSGRSAKGIGIGDTEKQIVAAYGEPIKRLGSPQGTLLVYANLLFILNEENKLRRWAVFLDQSLF
jgi:tetratricopeptide (TPR) repeat protein